MVSSPPYVCGSVGLSPLSFSVCGSILLGINRIGPFVSVYISASFYSTLIIIMLTPEHLLYVSTM